MARDIQDIIREIDASYNPQRQAIQQRIEALPGQADAEINGLRATQDQAFNDILGGARQRGLGFSGIPIQEQSKYTANQFLPAVARVRQSQNEVRGSLFDSLNNIDLQQRQYAEGVRQQELDRDLQRESADRQAAAFGGLLGGDNTAPQQIAAPAGATLAQRKDKGFAFTDKDGRPINAAQYAKAKNIPFRQLLQEMANAGDTGARAALGFVGDDFGYDPTKIVNQNLANLYGALTGRKVPIYQPAKSYNILTNQGANNARQAVATNIPKVGRGVVNELSGVRGGMTIREQLEAARRAGGIR